MSLDRRTFLSGATGAAALAATALPAGALASTDERLGVEAHVRELRQRWAAQKRDYLHSMFNDRPSASASELAPYTEALGEGLGALSTYKEIEQVRPEDQMHPSFQRLIHDVATGVGGMLIASRELLERFLDGADDDPHRETHLRAAMRSVRLGLADWPTTAGRQHALEHSLLEVEREPERGTLIRRVRRQIARLRRAEALSEQIAGRWHETGVLEIADPAMLNRMRVGQERWAASQTMDDAFEATEGTGVLSLPTERQAEEGKRKLVLGIVVLGVGCGLGGLLVLYGGCAVLCGGGAPAVLVLLAGLAVLGIAIWLGITLIKRGVDMKKGRVIAEDDLLGPKMATEVHAVPVVAEEIWVETGVCRADDRVLLVDAVGLVRSPSGWMADPDGNGTI
ncbi:MAG: hypothetical protein EXR69_14130, partial [Myxococcales bacterium]|nr:hypothetical protein [Myxococcales bacterium]